VGRLWYKTNSSHSGQTAQTCCSPWCTQRHIPHLDGSATPGRHKSRALHLGAGAEEEEIIQRDKRVQVGEQFLHDRSNLGSNLACLPLLLHGVCQAADARSHTKASKPHTSASHVAGETGVRRTIFLFFGIQHLRTRVALMPVASPTARCEASSTALVLPIGLREAGMRIGTLGLREVCKRGESD
jgi:hypothetical protein